MKRLFLLLSSSRLLFHVVLLKLTPQSNYFWSDFIRWKRIYRDVIGEENGDKVVVPFIKLMTYFKEFRNLYYFRMGTKAKFLKLLCHPMSCLAIEVEDLGPSFFIHHGFATIISAKRVGANCWVNQQVTIGYSEKGATPPVIGDNVTISCGAKVLGPLNIGNHVKVGANAVVVKDVPDNVTVVGVPARIVTRNGVRVNEKL